MQNSRNFEIIATVLMLIVLKLHLLIVVYVEKSYVSLTFLLNIIFTNKMLMKYNLY
jgi:hypothetical protein